MAAHQAGNTPEHDGLEQLLQTEAALRARQVEAEVQAARLGEEACSAVAARERRYDADLAAAVQVAAARIAVERDATIAALRAEAGSRAAQFRSLDDDRIEELATAAVDRILPLPNREST
jgi:hypothetical protein